MTIVRISTTATTFSTFITSFCFFVISKTFYTTFTNKLFFLIIIVAFIATLSAPTIPTYFNIMNIIFNSANIITNFYFEIAIFSKCWSIGISDYPIRFIFFRLSNYSNCMIIVFISLTFIWRIIDNISFFIIIKNFWFNGSSYRPMLN